MVSDKDGVLTYKTPEPTEDLTTWIFEEESFVPVAKLQNGKKFSIFTDHLGTPRQMYNAEGEKVWERTLDLNGKVISGDNDQCPFTFQGQYYDKEINLSYNRFRYYDAEDGRYISQDPIGLASGEFGFYNYVEDSNGWIDVFGLNASTQEHHIISDKNDLTKNHDLFKKAGYDNPNDFLQSSRNKIDLPTKYNTVDTTSSIHTGKHRKIYSENIVRKMNKALIEGKKSNWNESQYRNALGKIADEVRGKLERGEIALNKNKRKNSSYSF